MATLRPQPSITFDHTHSTTQRNPSDTPSRVHSEIETPSGPIQRDALASLAPISDPSQKGWPSGWQPYLCLLGGFLLMFNSWGLVNAYGTFASHYMSHLLIGRDLLLINLIGSTQCFVVLALSGLVGRFLDAGYTRYLIALGGVLVTLGTFLISVSAGDGSYNQGNYGLLWLTQGFISALGMACFFVSSSQVVATWFKAKKGFAIGIVASGASIAGLIYPLSTRYLIQAVGFNNAVRYVATIVAVTAIIAFLAARPNPEHPIRTPDRWTLRVFVDPTAFQNPAFCWLCAAIAFLFFGFYAVFFNLEEWATVQGVGYRSNDPTDDRTQNNAIQTFLLLSVMNASSTLGRLASSYLCDKLGALNVHAFVTFVAALFVLCLWTLARSVQAALAFVVLFGVFSGAVIGLPPASVAYILGPDPAAQAKLGQWTGMMYTCAAIPALTGPVIAGHLISEYDNNFLTVQLWSGVCLFLSACCMSLAIFCRRRQKKRVQGEDAAISESEFSSQSQSRWQSEAPSVKEKEKESAREGGGQV